MPHDREQQRQAARKHGVYAISSRGEEAMTPEQRQTLREIEQQVQTPEGMLEALVRRVAMGVMVLGVLESYIKAEVEQGRSLDSIKILKSWPAFQNSTVRALAQLKSWMPKQAPDTYQEALRRTLETIAEIQAEKEAEEVQGAAQSAEGQEHE